MRKQLELLTDRYLEDYRKLINAALILPSLNLQKEFTAKDFEYYLQASSVYSSNIEGNTIDFDTWLKNKAFKIKSKPKETAEIEDLLEAYNYATVNSLTQKSFLQTHQILSKTILALKSQRGKYRKQPVGIYSDGKLEYLAVEPEFVQREMDKLFRDISLLLETDMDMSEILYYASMIHLLFEKIHPFMDGNGRAGRLLEKWFLVEKIGKNAWNFETEKYYAQHRTEYYQSIHIGFNYYALKMDRFLPFSKMLISALGISPA
ncbi:Fic family protein [Dyadobacter arcticus]|uniref:Fic family protein n=1 Tax=Dyadobacter arcticus TaxID=1078754 RepID=A0ABX0UHA6_9BACT|nr:Fic family protein [Dyadobacter arcticus]NIJ51883.1 Fic family protein [Dyadobacter arcticus]